MTRRTLLAATLAVALAPAAPVWAREVEQATSDGSFRFEWEVTASRKGPRLDAYIYNLTLRPVQSVRVLVEQLDDAGNAVHRSTVQVWGVVPAGDRAFFQVPRATAGARYRLSVVNYDLAPVGGGGG
ncbi:MAG TPA: hypothetical protein VFV05_19060 [Methylomirabilota bacterium]|nr:hypothetical protein [Methylomirabilota bacterium]